MPYLTQGEIAAMTSMQINPTNIMEAMIAQPSLAYSIAGQASSSIAQVIMNLLANQSIADIYANMRTSLGRHINLAMALKGTAIPNVPEGIEETAVAVYDKTLAYLQAGLAQGVGGLHASLYESITGVANLVQSYNGLIQRIGIDPYVSRWVNSMATPNIPTAEAAWFMRNIGVIDSWAYDDYMAQNGWSDEFKWALEQSWIRPVPIAFAFDLARRGVIDSSRASRLIMQSGYTKDLADMMTSLIPQLPEPYRVADFAAKGLVDQPKMFQAFEFAGLSHDWALTWLNGSWQIPSFSLLAELKWRGLIDDATFNLMITRSGTHPSVKDKLLSLTEQIPPAQDITTMVVREAFEAANIVTAPTEFDGWMKKKGFSSYWNDKYWTAHFLPMPIQYGYANLHRGFWDKAQFLELLRIADIHPRWREGIYNVAFNPPTVRELGYGYDTGAYTQEDIKTYRRWGGLSEVDATKSAQALVDYRLDAERNALRTGNMNLYINNAITREQFEAALVSFRTNAAAVELWLQRGDMQIRLKQTETSITEPKNITRSDVQWLYEKGVKDAEWFKNTLKTIGYTDEAIETYLAQSNKRMSLVPEAESKNLTRTDVQWLYENKLFNQEQFTSTLKTLGYMDGAIYAYLQQSNKRMQDIVTPPKPAVSKDFTLAQLTDFYHAGFIEEDEVLKGLKKLNYSDSDILTIIQDIMLTIPTAKAAPILTAADADELYKFAYYDEGQLIQQYENHGYSHNDAILKAYLTVLEVQIPIFTAQYRNGWIGESDLYYSIMGITLPFITIGIPEKRVSTIMTTIVKNTKAERVAAEKDLTKAEILKGDKANVIQPEQAVQLLENLGYSEDESYYLLAINKIVVAGDPKGYWDMRQATELYKRSQGLPYVTVPNELIQLEALLKNSIVLLNTAKSEKKSEVELGSLAVAVANIQAQMNTIVSKLKIT